MAHTYETHACAPEIQTMHEWECITSGCPHRTPPRMATAQDAFASAMHHVRHTGHRVCVSASMITRTIVDGSRSCDADDWGGRVR